LATGTNSIILKTFDLVPKKNLQLLAQDQKFLKHYFALLRLLILCQNMKVIFWHKMESLLETFDLVIKFLPQDRMHY
jgi:hypothetical protein